MFDERRVPQCLLPTLCGGGSNLYLACPASPIHYQSDPVQTTKTSVAVPDLLGRICASGC
jgi:hypothetical protein